jgi:hypothetical protein
LSNAIAATAILDINAALAIATANGFAEDKQVLRNWSKRSFTSASEKARNENSARLEALGLLPAKAENGAYAWMAKP